MALKWVLTRVDIGHMWAEGGPRPRFCRWTPAAILAAFVACWILTATPAVAVPVGGGTTTTTTAAPSTTTTKPSTTTTKPSTTTTKPSTTTTAPSTTTTTTSSQKVSPILECVWHVASTNWLALWGYDNLGSTTQTIPVGSNNSFSPGSANQGQPTSFSSGTNDNVFTVPFVASAPPAWTLDATTVKSSPSDKQCSSDPVPIVPGTGGWSTELLIMFLALGILGVGVVLWRVDPDLLPIRRSSTKNPPL
jgi:hypothetical protein